MLITADDRSRWVIKFQNNRHGLRALVNEWVCHSLAKELQLPVPDFTVINLAEELVVAEQILVSESQPLGKGGALVQHGSCFGEKYIVGATHPGPGQMSLLTNGKVIPGVVVF